MMADMNPNDLNKEGIVGRFIKDTVKAYSAVPLRSRLAVSGVLGGAVGALTSDKKGDSVTGTLVDAGKGAAVHMGYTYASDYIRGKYGDDVKAFFSKGVTTGDIAAEESILDTERTVARMKKVAKGHGIVAGGIAAIIGVGALASAHNHFKREQQVDMMKAEQEKQLTSKKNRGDQMISQYFGWNKHQDMGQLVMDMWDDRIGHHKMGNAKFQ